MFFGPSLHTEVISVKLLMRWQMRISKINFTKCIWWPNFSVQLNFPSFLPILLYQTSTFTFTFIIPSPPLPHHSSIKSLLCFLFLAFSFKSFFRWSQTKTAPPTGFAKEVWQAYIDVCRGPYASGTEHYRCPYASFDPSSHPFRLQTMALLFLFSCSSHSQGSLLSSINSSINKSSFSFPCF